MRAVLIDSKNQTIEEIEIKGGDDGKEINNLLGSDFFDAVTISRNADRNSEIIYIDANGLLADDKSYFMVKGFPSPLAGRGLCLGCDKDGEDANCGLDMEWFAENISFHSEGEIQLRARMREF